MGGMKLRLCGFALASLFSAAAARGQGAEAEKPLPGLTIRAIPVVVQAESGMPVAELRVSGTAGYPDGTRLDVSVVSRGPALPSSALKRQAVVADGFWNCTAGALPGGAYVVRVRFLPSAQAEGVVDRIERGFGRRENFADVPVLVDLARLHRRCVRREVAFQLADLGIDAAADSLLLTWRAPGDEDWQEGELKTGGGLLLWTAPADGVYELKFFSARHFDPTEKKEPGTGAPWSRTIRLVVGGEGGADGVLSRARFLMNEGKWREAEAVLRMVLEADPESAEALAAAGHARIELGDFDGAELALAESIRLDPQADAMFNLAVARTRLKKYEEAWKSTRLALKWAGAGTRLLERAAELGLELAPRLDEPREAWEEVVRWAPETAAGKKAAELLRR